MSGCIRWAFNSHSWHPKQAEWTLATQCVQPEERERISKFYFKRDAKASMVGRLMIRKVVHLVTGIPYEEIQLGRTDKGKPYIINDLPWHCRHFEFNVSHQGEYVVLASEAESLVGIDIMKLDTPRSTPVPDFLHTMRRQFTFEEMNFIKSSGQETHQLRTFYRLWCLKESYVKALGIGIGFEVERLNFDLVTPLLQEDIVTDTTLCVDGKLQADWKFEEYIVDNHCIAVARKSKNNTPLTQEASTFKMLTFTELVDGAVPLSEPDLSYWESFRTKSEDQFQTNQR
ncbi:hypothetical protein ACJMK2_032265 [Sinanodonta woodiana]|uniref:L-aminoadipate-semialdehyde dehydrogenase-phosphopantetheinyl transferase n=1 Tax=Sinanodonta woodiana TaxID=1069815 RepID=A0ABD3X3B8_SINWO